MTMTGKPCPYCHSSGTQRLFKSEASLRNHIGQVHVTRSREIVRIPTSFGLQQDTINLLRTHIPNGIRSEWLTRIINREFGGRQ